MAVFANVLTCIAGFGFVNLSIAFAGATINEIVVRVAEKQKALGRIRGDGRVAGINPYGTFGEPEQIGRASCRERV